MVLAAMALGVPGCMNLFSEGLPPGTYEGDLDCTITVTDPEGTMAEDEFTSENVLVVGDDGALRVNGEAIVEGEEVTRAIPTADLSFEIIEVVTAIGRVTVSYEPRPTLPGISAEGELVERYERASGGIEVTATTDLDLTDVSGTSRLVVRCEGLLSSQDDP